EDDAAHQLDVEDPLARLALARLTDARECVEEHVLERFAVLVALPKLGGLAAEVVVGELFELGLERGDVGGLIGQRPQPTTFACSEALLERTVALRHEY